MPVPVDPFDEVLRPPTDETPEQRAVRLAREEQARKVSAAIDASIKAERNARRKKRIVRLLLLGQSESGKSTTLRQFQRLYTPTAFREERVLWRAVIQLNIVRSIRTILDALDVYSSPQLSPYSSPHNRARSLARHPPLPDLPGAAGGVPSASVSPPRHSRMHLHRYHAHAVDSDGGGGGDSDGDYEPPVASGSTSNKTIATDHRSRHTIPTDDPSSSLPQHHQYHYHYQQQTYYSNHIQVLKSRLSPIRHIEQLLISRLVPPNEEEPTHLGNGSIGGSALHFGAAFGSKIPAGSSSPSSRGGSGSGSGEVFVRPTTNWRGALARARVSYPSFISGSDRGTSSDNSSGCESGNRSSTDPEGNTNETQETLNTLCRDMVQLWQDPGVREVLKRKKIRLEEESGFFLNDLQRVTSLSYVPSDDDVLKARLKTVGVAEYRFEMEVPMSRDTGTEWRIVDVGGSRSQVCPVAIFSLLTQPI